MGKFIKKKSSIFIYFLVAIVLIISFVTIHNHSNTDIDNIHKYKTFFTVKKDQIKIHSNVDYKYSTNEMFGIVDKIYKIKISCIDIELTLREFSNTDSLFFYQIVNDNCLTDEDITFTFDVGIDNLNEPEIFSFANYDTEKEFSNRFGYDKITLPSYYFDYKSFGSMLISKNINSRLLEKTYETGNYSSLRELISEEILFDNTERSLIINTANCEICEGWVMVSKNAIFKNKNAIYEYIENRGNRLSWITSNGVYVKIPWSIDPYTEDGYARRLGNNQGMIEYQLFKETGEKFYYNITMSKLKSLFNLERDPSGIWYSEYTSTYISNFGIKAPYIDTRYNEQIAEFLTIMYDDFSFLELEDTNLLYPNYLLKEINSGNIIYVDDDCFLIPDYFDAYTTNMTHASLNHQLGTANLLLNVYFITGNSQYYDAGMKIFKGVAYWGDSWIRDNGDLWYKIDLEYVFSETDYPIVTLDDLLKAQQNLEKTDHGRIEIFDTYIASKYNYLTKNDINIPIYTRTMIEEQQVNIER